MHVFVCGPELACECVCMCLRVCLRVSVCVHVSVHESVCVCFPEGQMARCFSASPVPLVASLAPGLYPVLVGGSRNY